MKIKLLSWLYVAAIALNSIGLCAQTTKEIEEAEFITLGNCYECKLRIEGAVQELEGIVEVNWNPNKELCFAKFDNTATTLDEIMLKIASVGHDTEWHRAPDEAYALLIGTCCEYDRWLTYEFISENNSSLKVDIYPNPTSETIKIEFPKNTDLDNLTVKLYNLQGQILLKQNIKTRSQVINLADVKAGKYMLVVFKEDKINSSMKIIKNK